MSKVKLEQQPTQAFVQMKKGTDCVYRSLINDKLHNIDIQWGTLMVWDAGINSYDTPYTNFHMWNISNDDTTIYDDLSTLPSVLEEMSFKHKPISKWNVMMVDGSSLNIPNHSSMLKYIKTLNKIYKGKYDAIYVTELGWSNDYGNFTSQYNWDTIEEDVLLVAEEELV